MVLSFVVFNVIMYVFAWSQSQLDELASWLPKPILVLLEGGTAWGWRCLGVALLEGGAAWGWHCSGAELVVYMNSWSTEYLWSLLDIDAIQWWLIGAYWLMLLRLSTNDDHRTMLCCVFWLVSLKCLGGKSIRAGREEWVKRGGGEVRLIIKLDSSQLLSKTLPCPSPWPQKLNERCMTLLMERKIDDFYNFNCPLA